MLHLKELHWLPMEQRITFKVLLLTFKALNNLAPPYLSQLIVPITIQKILGRLANTY